VRDLDVKSAGLPQCAFPNVNPQCTFPNVTAARGIPNVTLPPVQEAARCPRHAEGTLGVVSALCFGESGGLLCIGVLTAALYIGGAVGPVGGLYDGGDVEGAGGSGSSSG